MNDHLDTVLRERFSIQHDALPSSDLADVHKRISRSTARRNGGRRADSDGLRARASAGWRIQRPATVLPALLAAVVLSAAAYAVVRLVIVGSPAPPPVRASEKVLALARDAMVGLNPPGSTKVEVAKTEAGAVLNTSSGPVYLWVAPTTSGSRCLYLQITGLSVRFAGGGPFLMAAGCVSPDQSQPLLYRVNTGVQGHTLALVGGYVPPPARTLQLQFANGNKSERFAITNGFVVAQGSSSDPRPTAIVRDRHGDVITPNPVKFIPQLFVSASPTGPVAFTITLHLLKHLGNLVLHVAPAARGGTCSQISAPWGAVSSACGGRPLPPDEIEVSRTFQANFLAPHQQIMYLIGEVGTDVATLELRYQNGGRQQLPIHHRWSSTSSTRASRQPNSSPVIERAK
jgi:hypothetical protein